MAYARGWKSSKQLWKLPLDGNYLNNSEDNLDLICPNCHSLTPTYKGANLGNGRKERNKYNLPN